MRLSYSRLDYYKEVFDQKVEPFIRCHINAFEYFAGKIESGVKYRKNNFFKGRIFLNYSELLSSLKEWLNNKYNLMVHGTTRKVPMELFKAEKAKVLRILPTDEFVIPLMIRREAYRDCHVYINYNYYSTPYQYVGKTIEIELKKGLVYILYNGQ